MSVDLKSAATTAGLGASVGGAVGTVFPVIGNIVGGAVGGILGLAGGLIKQAFGPGTSKWHEMSGADKTALMKAAYSQGVCEYLKQSNPLLYPSAEAIEGYSQGRIPDKVIEYMAEHKAVPVSSDTQLTYISDEDSRLLDIHGKLKSTGVFDGRESNLTDWKWMAGSRGQFAIERWRQEWIALTTTIEQTLQKKLPDLLTAIGVQTSATQQDVYNGNVSASTRVLSGLRTAKPDLSKIVPIKETDSLFNSNLSKAGLLSGIENVKTFLFIGIGCFMLSKALKIKK